MGYPTTIDSLPVDIEDRDDAATGKAHLDRPEAVGFHADLHNDVNTAVNAIEQALGIEVQGEEKDLAARLAIIESTLIGKQDSSTATTDIELSAAIESLKDIITTEFGEEEDTRKAADTTEKEDREAVDGTL